ncbi:MAG TPA: hypothetical protein VFU81_17760 [Thermomicrobiales bacterium]|nr:hypothetical protein [Thermomicrobiales bacterium]
MEQKRFEEFARGLVASISRRGMVRTVAAAAIGAALAAAGAGEAGARQKKQGSDKRQGKAGASGRKRRCKAPNVKCGKGKHAPCCTPGQRCDQGACVKDTRTVTLTWKAWVNPSAPDDHGFCYPTIDVTGFAPGTHQGFAYTLPVTIVVGADGTGSGSAPNSLIASNSGSTVATVDGVASAAASTNCWA